MPETQETETPVLESSRVRLIPFTAQHAEDASYFSWLRDRDVVASLNLPRYWLGEVKDEEIRSYALGRIADPSTHFFALLLRNQEQYIGTAKAGPIDFYSGTADVGIMIGDKKLWGQGLATDALSAVGQYLFEDLGLRRLTAGSMATNPGMIRVFEKLGFRREGLFRQHDRLGDEYIDHIHLGCFQDEFQPSPI